MGAERMAIAARMDGHFSAHPGFTLAHVIAGGLSLAFAPLQFSAGLRGRHPRLHRIVGRLLAGCALVSVIPAFYFGMVEPFGGRPETVVITLFGALFALALAPGVRAIRAGRPLWGGRLSDSRQEPTARRASQHGENPHCIQQQNERNSATRTRR